MRSWSNPRDRLKEIESSSPCGNQFRIRRLCIRCRQDWVDWSGSCMCCGSFWYQEWVHFYLYVDPFTGLFATNRSFNLFCSSPHDAWWFAKYPYGYREVRTAYYDESTKWLTQPTDLSKCVHEYFTFEPMEWILPLGPPKNTRDKNEGRCSRAR